MSEQGNQAEGSTTGARFGNYLLLKRLAVGGMAEVFLAKLEAAAGFHKPVVIKQVLPHLVTDPVFVQMFLDEAHIAARLSHPNIAQTFDLGEVEGRYYLAMEFVPGETLHAVLRRAAKQKQSVPLSCSLRVCLHLLEALEYAHGLKDESGQPMRIVHRDVSPSNLLLTYHGGVKLLDFGIARAATSSHQTNAGTLKGKLGYMAPEQCRSAVPIDHRADLFAAGAVLYAMVAGRPAFDFESSLDGVAEKFALMLEARFDPPRQVRPDLPEEIERILLRAMAKEPEARYQSAAEMAGELERFVASAGLYPGAQALGEYVRALFPEKGPLAELALGPADAGTLALAIEQTRGEDSVSLPRSRRRAPSVPEAAPGDRTVSEAMVPGATIASATIASAPTNHAHPVATAVSPTVAGSRRFAQSDSELGAKRKTGRWLALGGVLAAALGLGAFRLLDSAAPVEVRKKEVEAPAPSTQPARPEPEEGGRGAVAVTAAGPSAAPGPAAPAVPSVTPAARAQGTVTRANPRASTKPTGGAAAHPPRGATGKGRLVVDCYPWCQVRTSAGLDLGTSPVTREMAGGEHLLVLENPPLGISRKLKVTVQPGQTTTRYIQLKVTSSSR